MVIIKKYVPIAKEQAKKSVKSEKSKKAKRPKRLPKKVKTYPVKSDYVRPDDEHVAKLKLEHARRKAERDSLNMVKTKGPVFKRSISKPVSFLINTNLVTKYCKVCDKNYEVSPDRLRCIKCDTVLIKASAKKSKKPVKTSKPKKPKKR